MNLKQLRRDYINKYTVFGSNASYYQKIDGVKLIVDKISK